ncbi:hypothetical protein HZH68_013807 [Vespula germanica]|uniref:Uncharacterized protein n=1 Tax=Vespula germanica TaxID=30212 RepID=A0A834JDY3_VESGE|nr:hypothetical protein HZH68_013807 [Vespula germanica]
MTVERSAFKVRECMCISVEELLDSLAYSELTVTVIATAAAVAAAAAAAAVAAVAAAVAVAAASRRQLDRSRTNNKSDYTVGRRRSNMDSGKVVAEASKRV